MGCEEGARPLLKQNRTTLSKPWMSSRDDDGSEHWGVSVEERLGRLLLSGPIEGIESDYLWRGSRLLHYSSQVMACSDTLNSAWKKNRYRMRCITNVSLLLPEFITATTAALSPQRTNYPSKCSLLGQVFWNYFGFCRAESLFRFALLQSHWLYLNRYGNLQHPVQQIILEIFV